MQTLIASLGTSSLLAHMSFLDIIVIPKVSFNNCRVQKWQALSTTSFDCGTVSVFIFPLNPLWLVDGLLPHMKNSNTVVCDDLLSLQDDQGDVLAAGSLVKHRLEETLLNGNSKQSRLSHVSDGHIHIILQHILPQVYTSMGLCNTDYAFNMADSDGNASSTHRLLP